MYINIRKKGNIFEGNFSNNGKRFYTYGKNKKDTFDKLSFLRGYQALNNSKYSLLTFNEWLTEWLDVYKKPYVNKTTLQKYEINIRLHIPISLKNTLLVEITTTMLQKALNNVKTSRIREDIYNLFNACFKRAYSLDLILKNPCDNLIRPKHQRIVGSAFSPYELAMFLENIKGLKYENYFKFLLLTGCRRNEALTVCWSDIDLEQNTIHIKGTKTKSSDRIIPIVKELKILLDKMPKKNSLLFPFNSSTVTHVFKKFSPLHRLHDTRHTFATRCLENGIPLKVVQSWLGHSDYKVTASVYSHVMSDFSQNQSTLFKLLPQ